MKVIVLLLIVALPAYAAEEATDTPVLSPDVPNVTVRLRAGETAPFDGRLLSLEENLRRGKSAVDCRAELAKAQESALLPVPALIAIIGGSLALGVAVGAGVTALALRK